MAVGVAVGLDHRGQPARPLDPGVLQGAQAVLPVQGHLVRPGEERELRRRGGAHGLPARPRRQGRRRGRRRSPPPAPWCSAARRSWCWTRSGRWCCSEDGAAPRRQPRMIQLERARRRPSATKRVLDGDDLDVPDGAEHRHHRLLRHRQERHPQAASSACSSRTRAGWWWTARWCSELSRDELAELRGPDRLRLPVRGAVRLDDGGGEHRARPRPARGTAEPTIARADRGEPRRWSSSPGTEDKYPAEL